ncbi:hypothetical protein HFN98_10775 [Rhizobium laguerreae]|uniref:hypothetical protein n=1 Tax=Rhizobium laguerreae TaxID=1076926 RepID=UPI001C90AEC0|nr:hypothetical protein [Rhizobium laguerreae]MBY3331117.1 hypothetical protein [Rhizobium laguerreae]
MLSAPMSFPFFLLAAEGMRQTTASGRYDMQVFIRRKWKRSHFNGRQQRVKTVRYRTIQSVTPSCVRLKKTHGAVKHIVSEFHRQRRFDPFCCALSAILGMAQRPAVILPPMSACSVVGLQHFICCCP